MENYKELEKKWTITEAELASLIQIINDPCCKQRLKTRACIIIGIASGAPLARIGKELNITRKTAYKWLHRYLENGVRGLGDRSRTGRPSSINREKIELVEKLSQQNAPGGKRKWTISELSKHANISTWQVRQVYKHLETGSRARSYEKTG